MTIYWTLNFLYIFFKKKTNIKFNENLSSGNGVVSCRRTDVTKLIVALHNFANAPKKQAEFILVEKLIWKLSLNNTEIYSNVFCITCLAVLNFPDYCSQIAAVTPFKFLLTIIITPSNQVTEYYLKQATTNRFSHSLQFVITNHYKIQYCIIWV